MPDDARIPTVSFENLLSELENEKSKRESRTKRTMRRLKWSVIPLCFAVLSLAFLSRETYLSTWFQSLLVACCALPIIVSFAGNFTSLMLNREREIFAAMARLEDKRILPHVLAGLRTTFVTIPTPLLIKLLESVEASDAEMLYTSQYEILVLVKRDYDVGGTTYDEMVKIKYAALHALKQIGGQTVLSEMERLAVRLGQSREDPPLLEAIEECLPFVRQRAAHATTAQSLLRASSLQTQQGDILLRAATGGSASHETQSEQLLRGSSQNSSPVE